MDNIKAVYALKYGQSVLSEGLIFRGGDKDSYRPISFTVYLIVTEKRLILVDAGCDTMPNFEMCFFRSPARVLEELGYSPLDITDLMITHAHHDHIEATGHFRNATVYLQSAELDRGRKYIPEDMRVVTFHDELSLPPVKMIKIGGHSAGSSIVTFELENKTYVIVGDECYLRECVDRGIPTGASVCPEKSEAFIEKYGDCELLFCHDGEILPESSGYIKII